MARISKRSARAVLIDDSSRLVLIKRTRPGEASYWVAPGGGVDPGDASPEGALRRELLEELGAKADRFSQVFLFSTATEGGTGVQHFFACRLIDMDVEARSGPEFADPTRGAYEVDLVSLQDDSLAQIALKPPALKEFILANRDALLSEVGEQG